MERNILYSLIAHYDRSGFRIICEYSSEDSSVYREIILEVINSVKSAETEKISIQRGVYTVHLLIGGLYYAALTLTPNETSSLSRIAASSQIFLDRLMSVYKELPILADFSHDLKNCSIIDLSTPLMKIQNEFNNREIDVVPKLKEELAEVRRVLLEGVQKLIDRGQRLEDLVQKTQTLEITVRDFKLSQRPASRKKNFLVVVATSIAMILSTVGLAFFVYIDFL